jgi:hypothetical protein
VIEGCEKSEFERRKCEIKSQSEGCEIVNAMKSVRYETADHQSHYPVATIIHSPLGCY